ncbi:dihydrofolate reductase family protein [Parafrankia sp. EUN1f]|uniref:dihydrofolate reductase family protein n=1 Tax=Parafrankia sp. EUN1f TaxID=102897 RepID=UPI0001C44282|nr:dihydrofolate reductase family protein [Parafrankia sp. EUN1f]EFC85361.1 bifunctional deaminase-reductase domain protein [Parafrankia sp. EUN1f]
MRLLTASYFISLDGVVDSPQTWHLPYANEEVMQVVGEAIAGVDALLLGRHTFEEWKAFWPGQSGYPLADFINGAHKYVATDTLTDLGWAPSTILSGDVVTRVADLKSSPGGDIAINGSATLTRHLLQAGLVDELRLLVHPLVVGRGKHLFETGSAPVGLALESQRTFGNGVTYQVYRPALAANAANAA